MRFPLYLLPLYLVAAAAMSTAWATPAQVLIIRHGEKINDKDTHLSPRGQARAAALVEFFTSGSLVKKFGPPVAIYAAKPKSDDGSVRAFETVEPLAKKLGLTVNQNFEGGTCRPLAEDMFANRAYDGKTVVISWVHDKIPKLADKIGAEDVPDEWDGDVFDRVWRIRFTNGVAGPVEDLPQHLLSGDSKD